MSRWLAVAFALVAQTAAGHATLIATTPSDGERLQGSPPAIVLEFDEPVAPLSLTLVDDRGTRYAANRRAVSEGRVVRLVLDTALAAGGYIASYRVASADSHAIAGAIAFSIGAHAVPQHAQPSESMPTLATVGLRVLHLAMLLLTAGAAAYLVLVGTFPAFAKWITYGATGAVLTSIAVAGDRAIHLAADSSGTGVSQWAYAAGPCVVVIGAIGLMLTVRRDALAHRGAVLASAALMLASLVTSGHATTGVLPASALALFVHIAGVAFWAGALVALHFTLRNCDGAAALRRFSTIAQVVVPVALAAGLVFAALELRSLGDLASTPYGQLVIVKVGVTAVLLLFAAANRLVFVPAVARGNAYSPRWLRRSVVAEIVMVAVLVAVGATLGMTPPPRHDASERTVVSGGIQARIRASGDGVVDVHVASGSLPIDAVDVWVQVRNERASIGPLDRKAVRIGPGAYRVGDLPLGIEGVWNIVVRTRIDDFTQHDFETSLIVRRPRGT